MSQLLGTCASCNRGIPEGYLPVVTKWQSIKWGSFKVQKPVELYCRPCGSSVEGVVPEYRRRRHKRALPAPDAPVMSLRDLAIAVFSVLNTDIGYTSREIAVKAELPEEAVSDIKTVLKKLKEAGKVKLVDGRWFR